MAKAERRRRKSPPAPPRLPAEITLATTAALDKKVLDLVVLDLRKGLAFTDFFIIGTGANVRQVQAIAAVAIEEELRKKGVRPALVEGYSRGEWVLLDYFDFIVHVFLSATRDFYALERLWGDAERVEIPA